MKRENTECIIQSLMFNKRLTNVYKFPRVFIFLKFRSLNYVEYLECCFDVSLKSFTILTKLKETCSWRVPTCNLACIKLSGIFRFISDSTLNLDLNWIRLSKGDPNAIFSFAILSETKVADYESQSIKINHGRTLKLGNIFVIPKENYLLSNSLILSA